MRTSVLAFVLAVGGFTGSAQAEKSRERLDPAVVPTSQTVVLAIDPERPDYSGRVMIELEIRERCRGFRFHSEGPRLQRIRLHRDERQVEVSHAQIADDLVEVTAAEPLRRGACTLTVDFENEFGTQAVGLYRVEHEGSAYAFTQFEADDAREAFPVWDEPGYKIPFRFTVTVPEGVTAVSNTPVASERFAAGRRAISFEPTPPLPPYLLALAVGPFETVPIPGLSVEGRIVTPRGQGHLAGAAQAVTGPVLAALEEYFGTPYPYRKLDLIAVPEFWPGAMEHPGAITFRDAALLIDPDAASVAQRRSLVRIMAHELAHQWFGNLVTMEWWDDLWLNEAFADWMGDKIADRVHPELGVRVRQLRRTQDLLAGDARPSTRPIRRGVVPGERLMEGLGLTYQKGKLVLSMFEEWVGEDGFRRGVIDYLESHAGGNATADDLWKSLDAATDRDVSGAMAGFLEQPGHPRIDVTVEGGRRLRLTQSRFRNAGVAAGDLRWKIPVVLRWSDGRKVRTERLLLDGESADVELDSDLDLEWVYPNAGAGGCYRWSVSSDLLETLTARANSELSAVERVELLGNLGALLDAGGIRGDEYARVVRSFGGDADPAVVTSAIRGLEHIRSSFVTEDLQEEFAAFVRNALRPALDRIGWERQAGESDAAASLRPELLNWLGDYGRDPQVRDHARHVTGAYVEDPAAVDPSVAGICLSLAALDGDRELFATFRARFESARVPAERSRFLWSLGAFRDPVLRERALAYALEGPLRTHEVLVIPQTLADSESGRQRAFDWMTEHYDALAARLTPHRLASLPGFGGGCSPDRLDAMLEFFEDPDRRVPGVERSIARTRDAVADCQRLRAREGPAVAAYLAGSVSGATRSAGGGAFPSPGSAPR